MRRFLASLFLLFTAVSLVFSEEFEGIAVGRFLSKDMDNTVKIFIKGSKMKMVPEKQISGTNGYPIVDFSARRSIFVFVDEKYYMEMPLDVMIKNVEEKPILLSEGGDEKYLGFDAKRFVYSDKDFRVEAIGTRDLKIALNPFIGVQRIGNEGFLVSASAHYLYKSSIAPLKIVVYNQRGERLVNVEIMAIQKQKLSDREFEVPEGFRRFSEVVKEKMKKGR
ncbi:MAG: DUF4412 domain-containing protein [Brevinematales bacterium]|nr:DUF4412 domain-containing protein [Brevinematales bacterium]